MHVLTLSICCISNFYSASRVTLETSSEAEVSVEAADADWSQRQVTQGSWQYAEQGQLFKECTISSSIFSLLFVGRRHFDSARQENTERTWHKTNKITKKVYRLSSGCILIIIIVIIIIVCFITVVDIPLHYTENKLWQAGLGTRKHNVQGLTWELIIVI